MDRKYFSSTKRGEIQELKDELHSLDKHKKRDAVKKVIASMTVGKDVSTLFPDVVQCMQTDSIELKKLVYLYVMSYAKSQPEIAVLAVNTFRKDASDPNPLIRALAVRTMGCIRLDQILEYLLEPLRRCCQDTDPYVRKTAATCVAKVWDMNPEAVEEQGFVEILQDMIGDSNPMVAANAIASLSEMSETSGRAELLQLDEDMISKVLAALSECTEWGQVVILDAISTSFNSSGASSKSAETVVERITARLSHANQAVVLAAVRVILQLIDKIESDSVVETLLYRKIAPPLVSLLASEPEVQFVALRCINLIVQRYPDLLQGNTKMFFCKYTDPIYIKLEKLELLIKLVTQSNVDQVLTELKDYATEVDVEFVRRTVRGIGKIAVKLNSSDSAAKCISVLLSLIELKTNYLVQEAVTVVRDIFRKYPTDYELIISALCENLDSLDQPEAKASMIWILGEYADRIEAVHEILTSFLETFADEPVLVQQQLLTACVKLYLKSPSTGQDVVTEALRLCTEDSDNPDLRDRAYIYWRMLSSDPEATKQVVLGEKPGLKYENSTMETSLLDKLLEQLSLVSSVLHRQSAMFLTQLSASPVVPAHSLEDEDDEVAVSGGGTSNQKDDDVLSPGSSYVEKMSQLKQKTAAVERGESILLDLAGPPRADDAGGLIDLL